MRHCSVANPYDLVQIPGRIFIQIFRLTGVWIRLLTDPEKFSLGAFAGRLK